MAHIDDGGRGQRDYNVELNLVPFIDLMSVCIIFLLLTAVWTQVSMIQIGSSIYAKKNASDQILPPQDSVSFTVRVASQGYVVTLNGSNYTIPKKDVNYNEEELLSYLQQVKTRYPEKTDAMIAVDDVLPYEELIRGMDILMLSGFPEISISTGG